MPKQLECMDKWATTIFPEDRRYAEVPHIQAVVPWAETLKFCIHPFWGNASGRTVLHLPF